MQKSCVPGSPYTTNDWWMERLGHFYIIFRRQNGTVSYYKFALVNYIGFHDKGMILAGGCGSTNGKPEIEKTDYLYKAYEFGKSVYGQMEAEHYYSQPRQKARFCEQ